MLGVGAPEGRNKSFPRAKVPRRISSRPWPRACFSFGKSEGLRSGRGRREQLFELNRKARPVRSKAQRPRVPGENGEGAAG